MSTTNPKVDAFLGRVEKWREELGALRAIALGCQLTEELKWGKPCYTFEGKNVAVLVGFKQHCVLLMCKGALLDDPHGILVQPTENTQGARQIRFTDAGQIAGLEPVLKSYLQEAVEAERAGLKVEYRKSSEFPMPDELEQKLDEAPAFKAAFCALTPGRQRGYALHFSQPKQSQTRVARIDKCTERILAGKGLTDQYAG